MPIIKDGQTPEGRIVACRRGENSTGECRVRMMTEEERAYYGDPVPRDKWQEAPVFACMGEEPPMPKEKRRRFDIDEEFSKKVRAERETRWISQAVLAEMVGCSQATIKNVELARFGLRPALKKKICEVFGWEFE